MSVQVNASHRNEGYDSALAVDVPASVMAFHLTTLFAIHPAVVFCASASVPLASDLPLPCFSPHTWLVCGE